MLQTNKHQNKTLIFFKKFFWWIYFKKKKEKKKGWGIGVKTQNEVSPIVMSLRLFMYVHKHVCIFVCYLSGHHNQLQQVQKST